MMGFEALHTKTGPETEANRKTIVFPIDMEE